MSDTPQPQALFSTPQRLTRAADFRVIFANHIRMRIAAGEFGLAFGFTDEAPDGPLTQENVMVLLTPIAAKVLAASLDASLRAYEEQHGVINLQQNTPEDAERMLQAISDAVAPIVGRK